jgi:hypothetical protein
MGFNVWEDLSLPWVSKSKLKKKSFCDFKFYLNYICKEKERTRDDAVEGTNLHMVFANFFKNLKKEHCFTPEFTDLKTPVINHPFRRFVYEASMQFIKPEHREWGKYRNIISNFATIETARWIRLNLLYKNKDEIFETFRPHKIEHKIKIEKHKLHGTIDRINIEPMPDGSKKLAIYDYKTGNVPKAIVDHIDRGNPYDWKLVPDSMMELHFYGLIYLLSIGWYLSDEIDEFLNDEKWWFITKDNMNYEQTLKYKKTYITSLGKNNKIFKDGSPLKKGDIILGFYYLNGAGGYRPLKQYGYGSQSSTILAINDIRSCWHNDYFKKHPVFCYNPDICSKYMKCDRYMQCSADVAEYRKIHPN